MERYSIATEEDGPDSAPRIVIVCRRCGTGETMNDETGEVALLDLIRWGLGHSCAQLDDPAASLSARSIAAHVANTAA